MYHTLMLEDLLDLIQLTGIYSDIRELRDRTTKWIDIANAMLAWLAAMRHPDGEIAFFNDAAIGQARPPAIIETYACRLGCGGWPTLPPIVYLRESGYIRMKSGPFCLIFDAAEVGASYIPGHAHADTLSFELSLGPERIITNSGTSSYDDGPVRAKERATSGHATIEVDGKNSSEVWASFRVGRRARPLDVETSTSSEGRLICTAAHDGYRFLRGKPCHRRQIELDGMRVIVHDVVSSGDGHKVVARFPLHPSVVVAASRATGATGWLLTTAGGARLNVTVRGAEECYLETGTFAAGFGHREARAVLTWALRRAGSRLVETEIRLLEASTNERN